MASPDKTPLERLQRQLGWDERHLLQVPRSDAEWLVARVRELTEALRALGVESEEAIALLAEVAVGDEALSGRGRKAGEVTDSSEPRSESAVLNSEEPR